MKTLLNLSRKDLGRSFLPLAALCRGSRVRSSWKSPSHSDTCSWYRLQISLICFRAGRTHLSLAFSSSTHLSSHLFFCCSLYWVQL